MEKKEFPNRFKGIRAALKLLLEQRRRARNARQDVEAYTKFPEAEDDLAGLAQYPTADNLTTILKGQSAAAYRRPRPREDDGGRRGTASVDC